MKRSGKKLWPWDRKRERAGERKRVSLINTRERESRRRKREGLLCLERVRETTAQLSEEEWGAHFPLKHHSLFLSSTFLLFLVLFWSSKSLCCAFPWKSCERRRKDWWSNREERKNEPEGCIFSLCTSLIGWSTVGQCWGFQLDVALVHALELPKPIGQHCLIGVLLTFVGIGQNAVFWNWRLMKPAFQEV